MNGVYVEKLTYTNSRGESISFNDGSGLCLDESEISGWSFSADSGSDRVKSFSRGVYSKKLNASIIADSTEQADYIKNKLHDVCIVDIEAETPGVLSCRGYEIECWINEGIHSEYTEWDSFDTLELNVISHSKYWYSRKTQHFELTDKELSEVIFDFPIGFPFDLYSSSIKSNILNNEILDADMILRIYGPVQSPSLTIAGHNYEVDVMISDKEYLEINTLEKTVFLYTLCGEKINCFSKRSRQSDVFQKLPTGNLKIYSDYQLIFDIVMLNRRAEPKW